MHKMQPNTKELHRAPGEAFGTAQATLIVRDRQAELGEKGSGYFLAGKLQSKETVIAGIDQTESTFIGLFDGWNIGRLVGKLI